MLFVGLVWVRLFGFGVWCDVVWMFGCLPAGVCFGLLVCWWFSSWVLSAVVGM